MNPCGKALLLLSVLGAFCGGCRGPTVTPDTPAMPGLRSRRREMTEPERDPGEQGWCGTPAVRAHDIRRDRLEVMTVHVAVITEVCRRMERESPSPELLRSLRLLLLTSRDGLRDILVELRAEQE